MKILSEKEQKQNKVAELTTSKNQMYEEIQILKKQISKEISKKGKYFPFFKVNVNLVNNLKTRIDNIQKVVENLTDYRDMIEESLRDKKD